VEECAQIRPQVRPSKLEINRLGMRDSLDQFGDHRKSPVPVPISHILYFEIYLATEQTLTIHIFENTIGCFTAGFLSIF
jgi:hypothetical protein